VASAADGDLEVPIGGANDRMANAHYTTALASRGVRSSVVRLPPATHGNGDNGFIPAAIGFARAKGAAAYVGDGANRWPSVHRDDAARLFRLALESAPAGSVLHAVGDEGVPIRELSPGFGARASADGPHPAYCGGMDSEQAFPVIRQTVLDTTDPRRLAEFYRQLFGLRYRPGDEPPERGQPDQQGQDWLVLRRPDGGAALAFQRVAELPEATWPDGPTPQQLHMDTTVPTKADLDVQHERALTLGARLLADRSDDPEEPLRVYADPAGHPFCIFVG
jgi:Glyoxalase-like domain